MDFQTAVAPRSCAYWFAGCAKLAEVLNTGGLDTSGAASMEGMFSGCSSLSSLDLSGWGTSGAESMYCMFDGCTGLSSVKLGGKFSFKGLFRYLQAAGEYKWKAYHRHSWLKPFAWLYQIGRYIRQGLRAGRAGRALSGDLERSRERYELLKRLRIQ